MSSETPIAFSDLYGRSSGKSKRLAANRSMEKTIETPVIRISPPSPIKEKAQVTQVIQYDTSKK